jgi:hypothetical protein
MSIEKLVITLHEQEEATRALRNVVELSEALVNIEEWKLGHISYNIYDDCVLITTKTYPQTLRALKVLRQETGQPMKLGMHWYSCGVMLFKWVSDHFTVRFECPPDAIPPELMPSEGCEVEESIQTQKTYSIVCPVKGDQ